MSQNTLTPQDIPFNLYKQNAPFVATITENTKLTGDDSPNDVRHLVINFEGSNYRYLAGQSAGIVPPGADANDKPHKIRLYSIASNAEGDDSKNNTLSLCVKRLVYQSETGEEVRGVCSNYLCDLKPGDKVSLTGPTGKAFLMPDAPNANIVMIATGTGIAPFRAFLKERYEHRSAEKGQAWLFFGMQYGSDFLYQDELESYQKQEGYHLVTAISREQQTADGRRMYVQDRLVEHRNALIQLMQDSNTYTYICGLRGMEKGILEGLETAANENGINWSELHEKMNAEKRWHVEVY